MLRSKSKISLNFCSILFLTFLKKLLKFLLSTYTEFIESFKNILNNLCNTQKIIEKKFRSMQRPSSTIVVLLPLPKSPRPATMVIWVYVSGELRTASISVSIYTPSGPHLLPLHCLLCSNFLTWYPLLRCQKVHILEQHYIGDYVLTVCNWVLA